MEDYLLRGVQSNVLVDRPFEQTTGLADGLELRHLFIIMGSTRDYRAMGESANKGDLWGTEYGFG